VLTPGRFIFAVPSKLTPPIVRAVCKAEAVATLPEKVPENPVAVKIPVAELKVRFVPVFGAKLPVAAVANIGKQVVSLDSSASVTCVAGPINESEVMPLVPKLATSEPSETNPTVPDAFLYSPVSVSELKVIDGVLLEPSGNVPPAFI